jgi:putative DNA primase/helicase
MQPEFGDILREELRRPHTNGKQRSSIEQHGSTVSHRTRNQESPGKREEAGSLVTRCLNDIEARPVCWLWPGRIARGKLTIIAGNPGVGKSQITASITAVVTAGGSWPVDCQPCIAGEVLILSAEDDPADTMRPRLEAAGVDLRRAHIVDGVIRGYEGSGHRQDRMFCLEKDLQALDRKLAELANVAVLIIDPITAYLGKTDSHKNAEVRGLLAPLADLAARHNVAIIAISHMPKAIGTQAVMRIIGSVAFVAAARAAYLVTTDSEDKTRRLFLPTKNNLGPDTTGLSFRIEAATVPSPDGPIETSRVAWDLEPVLITADEAIQAADCGPKRTSAIDKAKLWLQVVLADGPMDVGEVLQKAKAEGITEKTVRRAKKALGVEAVKLAMDGGWSWSLPPKVAKSAEDVQFSEVTTFEEVGHLRESEEEDG